ncbi:hypothetical protein HMPREF1624_05314 [Sporothrix schenckii ATCC 58251]|uniref:Uncharacterized protein n=1 Tax=Sporothrix schenckii (strain ATCC 58251 / de Perez 2211183) TaxID=1391915 RepID=U7PVP7_SPOS1|nr:hypothetical protein HMPREF1624_05314 [Sporothrix schenckii ATCC 58251]
MGAPPAESAYARPPEEEETLPEYSERPEPRSEPDGVAGPSRLPAYEPASSPPRTATGKTAPPASLPSMLDVGDGTSHRFAPDDVLPPAVFVLDGAVIYSATDPQRTPVYTLGAPLTAAVPQRPGPSFSLALPPPTHNAFSRMEPKASDPAQRKPRHIYNLRHGAQLGGPPLDVFGAAADYCCLQPMAGPTRRLGLLGFVAGAAPSASAVMPSWSAPSLAALAAADTWTALPFRYDDIDYDIDNDGATSAAIRPPSPFTTPGGVALWEARRTKGQGAAACHAKWVEAYVAQDARDGRFRYDKDNKYYKGHDAKYAATDPNDPASVALEYGGGDGALPRLVITTALPRQQRDALVALWCLRQWALLATRPSRAVQRMPAPVPPAQEKRSSGLWSKLKGSI